MSFSINWNDGEFKKNMDKIIKAFNNPSTSSPVGKGVLLAGQALLRDSQDIVPRDTDTLFLSGNADKVKRGAGGIEIDVGYNTEYAVKVHEDLTLNISQRKASKSGKRRQQKYLEQPMKENGDKYGTIIAQTILKYL